MTPTLKIEKDEIPLHFEGVGLRPAITVVGWLISIVLAIVGVSLTVTAGGWIMEAAGVAAAATGGVALVGLVRCRNFETVVDRRFVSGRAGPLNNRVPVALVAAASARTATSWRRLFSHREVVLETPSHIRTVIVPSRDPEALIEAVCTAAEPSG